MSLYIVIGTPFDPSFYNILRQRLDRYPGLDGVFWCTLEIGFRVASAGRKITPVDCMEKLLLHA